MTLTTNPGTGLRANKSPTGIKLANSEFTAQPNEELAAVDVYEVKEQGVVTSVVLSPDDSFFEKLRWAATGGVVDLTGVGDSLKGVVDSAKKGMAFAKDAMNTVGRVQSAINRVRNGGIMGALGVAAEASRAAGVEIGPAINTVRNVVSGVQQGGISGMARAADGLTGGNAITTAVNNGLAIRGAIDRVKNAGSIQGMLYSLDSAAGTVERTMSSLDAATQVDFSKGFGSVLSSPKMNQEAYNKGTFGKISTAISDFTSSFSDPVVNTATRAGIAAGLAVASAEHGNTDIFSVLRTGGLDDKSAFVASNAIGGYSLTTGNLGLLKNVIQDPIGQRGISSIPNVTATMASTVKAPSTPTPLKNIFDDLNEIASVTGQKWNSAVRAGKEMLSTASTQANDFMTSVLNAKADDDHFQSRLGVTTVDLTARMTDAQALSAAQVAQTLYAQ